MQVVLIFRTLSSSATLFTKKCQEQASPRLMFFVRAHRGGTLGASNRL